MESATDTQAGVTSDGGSGGLRLAGGLMVGGFLLSVVARLKHPGGREDEHEVIFADYAESGEWVAVHFIEFLGVLVALGGFLMLSWALRNAERRPALPYLAAGATVVAAAMWTALQAIDGIGLKYAVDAWDGASGTEQAIRFASAETVRWLEWSLQSYFRLILGVALILFGAAIVAGRRVAGWVGWVAVLAGVVSAAIGLDVGFNGLASDLQDLLAPIFQIAVLVFAVAVLAAGIRERRQVATGT